MRRLTWPSRNEPEEGFTLVELMVAMIVMFTALLVMAYTMLTGLSSVGYSRQRTEATALANQALEQIRALPASELYMSTSDISSDPTQLVSCGSSTCFNGRIVPIANFGSSPSTTPFTPNHITTTTALPGNTVYTVKSYLTFDPSDTTNHTLIATVQVSWSNPVVHGVDTSVQVESKIYNAQYNEAAPGIHTFTANASSGPGTITISGTVLGSNLANIVFSLPSTSAGMNGTSIPNTTNVGAASGPVNAGIAPSQVTAASLQLLNTPAATASAQSLAGNGANGQTNTSTPTAVGSLPGALGLVDAGTLTGTVSVGSTESASAEATSSAGGGTITSGSPAPPTNGLGFGRGTASQTGAVGANLSVLGLLGANVLGIGLVDLTPTGNSLPDYSQVAQNGTSGSPQTQTFNATASQQFGDINILNLSALGLPLFPGPVLQLSGFVQTASACAGPVTCTPTPQVDTGSLSILGGTPVSITDLLDGKVLLSSVNSLLTGVNISLAGLTTLGITGTGITLGTNQSPGSVPSPLSVNLQVSASLLGVSLLNLTINITLGSASASASYS